MSKITIEEKLGVNKFHVDETFAHIETDSNANPQDILVLVRACPAGLYKYEDSQLSFDYAGCFECGTCRILSLGNVIKNWNYPNGSMGIEYRYG